jgi:hypothetical protein
MDAHGDSPFWWMSAPAIFPTTARPADKAGIAHGPVRVPIPIGMKGKQVR